MQYEALINNIIARGYLKTPGIIKAFRRVDRQDFVREENTPESYDDYPLPIGHGQTISQPSTVAFMLELLQPEEADKILDIGAGSGWTTAILAEIAGKRGFVYGTELVAELIEFGRENLSKDKVVNAEICQADIQQLGLPNQAPFDRILVSAAADDLPQELVGQLKVGGRMVLPILDSIWKIDKISKDDIKQERHYGFAFVPLRY